MSSSAPEPLIVTVAPNGARKTQADHPALPIAPDELARTAADCRAAGAAMIHLHVRDTEGGHTLDVVAYRNAINAIRHAVGDGIVIQATSEAVGLYSAAEQMAMVRALRPEAVSLAIRELVPDAAAEPDAADFFAWLRYEGILPQFILYSAEEVARFDDLVARGVVPSGRHFLLFVLGRYTAGQVSDPQDLLPFIAANRQNHRWAVCAFGAREATCALAAACLDGHVRVGFENNLLLPDGRVAPDNAALVAAAAA
ncbi:MAG: 3-keto-5-aminohexanoate cleavage protein, partial [Kiloniellales bacterium]